MTYEQYLESKKERVAQSGFSHYFNMETDIILGLNFEERLWK